MKIYRIVQAGRREFWISAKGEVKTEADFEEESDISKDLFHLNVAMNQMREYLAMDDGIPGNLSDNALWEQWKQNKAQDINAHEATENEEAISLINNRSPVVFLLIVTIVLVSFVYVLTLI